MRVVRAKGAHDRHRHKRVIDVVVAHQRRLTRCPRQKNVEPRSELTTSLRVAARNARRGQQEVQPGAHRRDRRPRSRHVWRTPYAKRRAFVKEVGFHRAVIVEVVVAQVRERSHTEAKPLDAALGDRVARDLKSDDRVAGARDQSSPRVLPGLGTARDSQVSFAHW